MREKVRSKTEAQSCSGAKATSFTSCSEAGLVSTGEVALPRDASPRGHSRAVLGAAFKEARLTPNREVADEPSCLAR